MPHESKLGLPTGYRRRTLAKLDALIAKAEEDQAERLRTVERLAAAKKGTGFAKAGLRQAEYRLALLRGSRRWMAAGQPPGLKPGAPTRARGRGRACRQRTGIRARRSLSAALPVA